MKSYLAVVKFRFSKFLNKLILSDMKTFDKFILEQNYYDNEIYKISLDLGEDYTIDKVNAYNYIKNQKDLSKSLYLGTN